MPAPSCSKPWIPPGRRACSERTLNGLDIETFDDVALLHVLIIGESHAAFLARLHFFHFVLEAFESGKFALVDHDLIADQPHLRAAPDHALGDLATGDL